MTPEEKKLLGRFRKLSSPQRQNVLDFAEFLATRPIHSSENVSVATIIPEPKHIPRPQKESVVKAVRRLTQTYAMLDHSKLLHETSNFMTQHIMHGRPAEEVIGELEAMFERHYQQLKKVDCELPLIPSP